MNLEFKRLSEVDCAELVVLNTDPRVHKHMPLAESDYTEEKCRAWVEGKERQWVENGYGPWAFFIDGKFGGWGGFQRENGEPDLGLVLHPDYWGQGKQIFDELVRRGFDEMGFSSVTI